MATVRAFLALSVPAVTREALAAGIAPLRDELPAARWSAPSTWHLTLVFLGEIAEAVAARLGSALSRVVARQQAFRLTLAGAGTFPPRRPARVAWIGFGASEELSRLQGAVAGVVAEVAGIAAEDRPFHAHVTLARCRTPWPPEAAARFESRAGRIVEALEPREWVADHVALMASELEPGGPRHRVLCSAPLEGAA